VLVGRLAQHPSGLADNRQEAIALLELRWLLFDGYGRTARYDETGQQAAAAGYALSERLVVEQGQILTASFMDYAVLKAGDMPELVVRLIESGEPEGPFGAKGLGESGVIPVSAAVANAVKAATGVRFAELPITPAVVHAALSRSGTGP